MRRADVQLLNRQWLVIVYSRVEQQFAVSSLFQTETESDLCIFASYWINVLCLRWTMARCVLALVGILVASGWMTAGK